jgi:hypothetical protein
MDSEIVLFNKEGFKFTRSIKNHYKLEFSIENERINIANIIDFNMIKLIYDLNPDVYEYVNLNRVSENEVIITLLMKHFFEDLGLPQRFSYINMKRHVETNKIVFHSKSIRDHRPPNMPPDSELMNMRDLICNCDIITAHKAKFDVNVIFDPSMNVPPFAEKMIGMILFKIFKRVKQFIENVIL